MRVNLNSKENKHIHSKIVLFRVYYSYIIISIIIYSQSHRIWLYFPVYSTTKKQHEKEETEKKQYILSSIISYSINNKGQKQIYPVSIICFYRFSS